MTHKQLEQLLNAAQSAIDSEKDFPCTNRKPDPQNDDKPTSCIGRDYGFDGEGRPRFWYGFDNAPFVQKRFCPTCIAAWLVAVARNIIVEDGRFHSNADDVKAAEHVMTGTAEGSWCSCGVTFNQPKEKGRADAMRAHIAETKR